MVPPGDYLLILHKDESTVGFMNPYTGGLVRKIPVDLNPHEVAVSRDGSQAFISCSGGNSLLFLDLKTGEITHRITHPDFKFPHGLDITHDGQWLWLVSTYSNKLFRISLADREIKQVTDLHQDKTHMVHLTPDGTRAYVVNIGSDNLTVLDVASGEILSHVPVGRGPEGLAIHPDGSAIYVANQHDNTLYVLDAKTHEVLHRRRLGSVPVRAVFSPDGRYCLVPNRESHDLSVMAHAHIGATPTPSPWEVKRIPVGRWPGGVVFRPDGDLAFVANNKTNDISIIKMSTLTEIRRMPCGIHPDGIAWVSVK